MRLFFATTCRSILLALSAIWAHKLRSFLTLLGIIFGVATVIVVVSLIAGFNKYIDEKIADIGTNAFRIQKFSLADFASYTSFDRACKRNRDITLADFQALSAQGGAILDVGAKAYQSCEVKRGHETLFEVKLEAATANMAELDRIEAAEGRYFTDSEVAHRRNVCFIGLDVAERLWPTTDPVGDTIKIDGRPFTVIGVARSLGSVFGQSRDTFVTIPLETLLSIYGAQRSLVISIAARDENSYQDAQEQARFLMRARRRLGASEPDNFGMVTPEAINSLREKIFGTIQQVAIGVTSLSLIVSGIVIMNIMLISVTERTKEIGLRKSLGARRSDILQQFLAESTIMALLGGAIGILVAYLLGRLVSVLTPIPTDLSVPAAAAALFVSASVGLISGIYPAWVAARLDAIVALRAE